MQIGIMLMIAIVCIFYLEIKKTSVQAKQDLKNKNQLALSKEQESYLLESNLREQTEKFKLEREEKLQESSEQTKLHIKQKELNLIQELELERESIKQELNQTEKFLSENFSLYSKELVSALREKILY